MIGRGVQTRWFGIEFVEYTWTRPRKTPRVFGVVVRIGREQPVKLEVWGR